MGAWATAIFSDDTACDVHEDYRDHVIETDSDKGGTYPICELLDWVGDEIPPLEFLKALRVRKTGPNTLDRRPNEITRFMIGRTSERELPQKRLRRLGIRLEPAQKRPPRARTVIWPIRVYLWRSLDSSLEQDYDIA
jgi:hypothetical protein